MTRLRPGRNLALQGLLAATLVGTFASPASAQFGGRRPNRQPALLIKVKSAHTAAGEVLSPATLYVRGSRIVAIGGKIPVREGAKVVDLSHLVAIPALIDPLATTYLDPRDRAGNGLTPGSPTHKGLVRLRPDQAREILEAGVAAVGTTPAEGPFLGVQVATSGAPGLGRQAAVAGLTLNFSSTGSDWLAADKKWKGFQKLFLDARKYRKAKKEAEEKRKEYDKKWKEYIAALEKANKTGKPGAKSGAKTRKPAAKPTGTRRRPTGRTPGRPRRRGGLAPLGEPQAGVPAPPKPTPKPVTKKAPTKPTGKTAKKPAKKGKTPTRPKRPAPFKQDPAKETLIQALEGKIQVRIGAHSEEEIHFALQLARQFELKVVLVDPYEAKEKDRKYIAAKRIPVLFGAMDRPLPAPGKTGFTPCMVARWAKLGCPVALGTGGRLTPRFLRDMAAHAVAMGLDKAHALRAVTLHAARAAGLQATMGSLEKNKRANILFFAGDPLDSSNAPERIMINGRFITGEVL